MIKQIGYNAGVNASVAKCMHPDSCKDVSSEATRPYIFRYGSALVSFFANGNYQNNISFASSFITSLITIASSFSPIDVPTGVQNM